MKNKPGWQGNFLLPQPPFTYHKNIISDSPNISNCLDLFESLFWKLASEPIESTEKSGLVLNLLNDFIDSLRDLIPYPSKLLSLIEIIFSSSFPSENVNLDRPVPLYTALLVILSYIPGDEKDSFCRLLIDLWKIFGTSDNVKSTTITSSLDEANYTLSIGDLQFIQSFICSLLPCLCWTYLTRTHLPPYRIDICHQLIKCCVLQERDNSQGFQKHWEYLMNTDDLDDLEKENFIGIEQLLIFFAQNYSDDIVKGSFEFINIQSAHTPWSSGQYLPSILNKASLFIKKLLSTRLSAMLSRKEILQRYEAEHNRSSPIKGNLENNESTIKDQKHSIDDLSDKPKRQGSNSSSSTETENFEVLHPNNRNKNFTGPLQILDSSLPSNMIPNFDDDPSGPSASTEFIANIPFYPIHAAYASNQLEIIKRCIGIYHSTIDAVLQRNSLSCSQIPSPLVFSPHKHPIALFFAHFSYAIFSTNFLPLEPISCLWPCISPDTPYKEIRNLSKLGVDLETSSAYLAPVPPITEQIRNISGFFSSPSLQSFGSIQVSDLAKTLTNLIQEDTIDSYDLLKIETDPWKTGKQRLQVDDPLLMEIGLTLGLFYQRIFLAPTSSSILSFQIGNSSNQNEDLDRTVNAIDAALKQGKRKSEFEMQPRAYWCFVALIEYGVKYKNNDEWTEFERAP